MHFKYKYEINQKTQKRYLEKQYVICYDQEDIQGNKRPLYDQKVKKNKLDQGLLICLLLRSSKLGLLLQGRGGSFDVLTASVQAVKKHEDNMVPLQ